MIRPEQNYASYFSTTDTLPVKSFDLVQRSAVRSTRLTEDPNGVQRQIHSDEELRPGQLNVHRLWRNMRRAKTCVGAFPWLSPLIGRAVSHFEYHA